MLASLRLCSSVPGQWAVQTALGGVQSIFDLTAPTGRLGRQRQADHRRASARSRYLEPHAAATARSTPSSASSSDVLPKFDDNAFAMALLEEKHVLVVPGSSFNVDYTDHFRITLLPDEETMHTVFQRMESLLAEM